MSTNNSRFTAAHSKLNTVVGPRAGLIQISSAAVLWGTTGVVVRQLHTATGLGPIAIGCYRLLAAAALLLVLSGPRLRSAIRGLRSHPWSLLAAGAGLGLYQVLYFISVADVGVGVSTVVSLGIAPVLTTVLEAVRARSRPGVRTMAVVLAAVAGLALVAVASTGSATAAAPRPGVGLLAAIGSGVGYALTTIVSRHAAQEVPALVMTTTSSVIGGLMLLPIALATGLGFPVSTGAVGQIGYLGAATTVLAYALFYAGLRTTASSTASVLTLLEPLTATALAVVVLAEPLPALTVAGGVLLLGAICVLYLAPAPAGAPPESAAATAADLTGGAGASRAPRPPRSWLRRRG